MKTTWTARVVDTTTPEDLALVLTLLDTAPECAIESKGQVIYGLFESDMLVAIFAGPRAKMAHTAQMFFNSISDRLPEELRERFSTEG